MDTAVALIQGYLQANGYFTITEMPVVEAVEGGYRTATDIDILAVRFPGTGLMVPGWTKEQREAHPFRPDPVLNVPEDRIDLLIGEIKEGKAEFNRGAKRPPILQVALHRLGRSDLAEVEKAARRLGRTGTCSIGDRFRARLVAFGSQPPDRPPKGHEVILLEHVFRFLQKTIQDNWDVIKHVQMKGQALGLLMTYEKARIAAKDDGV